MAAATSCCFSQEVFECDAVVNHLVNESPVGESSNVAVVNPHVGLDLARETFVPFSFFLGIVFVDCPEFNAAFPTPVDGVFEQFAFAHRPKNQTMLILDEHLQSLCGERQFFSDVRVFMFNDCSVEVYSNSHC